MARRGELARETASRIIIEAFGDKYVTTADKKIYVEVNDGPGGELLQFAISMTMPKNTLTKTAAAANDWSGPVAASVSTEAAISDEDRAKVQELMQELGLQ